MSSPREDILSAMQSMASDIQPIVPPSGAALPHITVDIGGIKAGNQTISNEVGRHSELIGHETGPSPKERRRDYQRRNILRLVGFLLLFIGILPLYLTKLFPNGANDLALGIGLAALIAGVIMTVYEDA